MSVWRGSSFHSSRGSSPRHLTLPPRRVSAHTFLLRKTSCREQVLPSWLGSWTSQMTNYSSKVTIWSPPQRNRRKSSSLSKRSSKSSTGAWIRSKLRIRTSWTCFKWAIQTMMMRSLKKISRCWKYLQRRKLTLMISRMPLKTRRCKCLLSLVLVSHISIYS